MKRKHIVLAVASLGALAGCGQFATVTAPADPAQAAVRTGRVQPSARTSAGPVTDLAELYGSARRAQARGDLAQARGLYRQLLALAPGHVDALNALGVLEAGQEHLDVALALFGQARAAAPASVPVRNNLGYALMLAGRLDQAEVELEAALNLDPSNASTRANLTHLQSRRAQELAQAMKAEPAAQAELVSVAPHMYEVRDPDSTLKGVRLEVSNGVGIRHLARRAARQLASWGLVTARLSNQPGFRQPRTELQYREGQREAARALAVRLPFNPSVVPAQLAPDVQLRLVLGHDRSGRAIAEGGMSESEPVAQATVPAGWQLV